MLFPALEQGTKSFTAAFSNQPFHRAQRTSYDTAEFIGYDPANAPSCLANNDIKLTFHDGQRTCRGLN